MNSHNKPSVRLAHTRTWGCTCSPCFLLLNNLQLKITVETWMFSQKKKKARLISKISALFTQKGGYWKGGNDHRNPEGLVSPTLRTQVSMDRSQGCGPGWVRRAGFPWLLRLWAEACDSGTGRWNPNVVTRGEPIVQVTNWHRLKNSLPLACIFSLSLSLPLPLSPFVKREVPLLGWPSPGLLIRNPQSQAHWRVGSGLLNIYQTPQVRSTREMIKTNAASVCIWIPGRSY